MYSLKVLVNGYPVFLLTAAIVFIMMIFMLVGAIDKIAGNKRGYGEKFDEGFNAMGSLAAAMAGVVAQLRFCVLS